MAITLPPPYNNAPIRPADVTQTMIDLYNVVAQINAGLSPVPINLSGPGGAALIGTTPSGGITSTTVQASLNELDTKKVPFTTLAAAGGAGIVGNTPAGGVSATTVQAAINELDVEKTSVATLAGPGGAALVGNTPAGGISSTTVQSAINELDTEKATIAAVQSSSYVEAIGTNTPDQILAAFTPTVTSLTNGLELSVLTLGPNTITNPAFRADATTPKIIVKGNGVALQPGDSQGWITLRYNSSLDNWVLLNPSTPAGSGILASSINGGQIAGLRNLIINGAMNVSQRATSATVVAGTGVPTASTGYPCVDRFFVYCTGANVIAAQVAGTLQTQKRLQITGAASVTAIGVGQRIESTSSYYLNGTTATLSVDLANTLLTTVTWTANYATTADTFGTIGTATKTQISTGTFTVSSTVTRFNAQISIPTAAITGIEIILTVGAQTSGTFTVGNMQLEQGSITTPFEQKGIGIDTYLSQRYFQTWTTASIIPIASGFAFQTNSAVYTLTSPLMRTTPVLSSSNASTYTASGTATALTSLTINGYSNGSTYLNGGVAATPLTVGQGTTLNAGIAAGGFISLSAEII